MPEKNSQSMLIHGKTRCYIRIGRQRVHNVTVNGSLDGERCGLPATVRQL